MGTNSSPTRCGATDISQFRGIVPMSDILRRSLIEMKSKEKEQTIRGTLLPIEWDENDRVVQIVLDTPGQVGYLIHPDGRGRELLQLLRQKVEVTGTLKADEAGDFIISVNGYKLLDNDGVNP
jgi:hypothetical protein